MRSQYLHLVRIKKRSGLKSWYDMTSNERQEATKIENKAGVKTLLLNDEELFDAFDRHMGKNHAVNPPHAVDSGVGGKKGRNMLPKTHKKSTSKATFRKRRPDEDSDYDEEEENADPTLEEEMFSTGENKGTKLQRTNVGRLRKRGGATDAARQHAGVLATTLEGEGMANRKAAADLQLNLQQNFFENMLKVEEKKAASNLEVAKVLVAGIAAALGGARQNS